MRLFQLTRKLFAIGFAACLAAPLWAQTFELSLEEGRVAARQAALSGQFILARDFALALIDADPDDRTALIVLAAVHPQLGDPRAGRAAGARAFRLSRSDGERYEAARLTALAAANQERFTLSQFWLRRAAANAPDAAALQQTRQDYQGIRALNPWAVNLGFSVTPSSNINGGSETDLNIIDGLPIVGQLSGDAQALSGLTATADLRLSYALRRSENARTGLTARTYIRAAWLSDEAAALSPGSRNSDFGSQILELGVIHQRRAGQGDFTTGARLGAAWFGGDLDTGFVNANLGYSAMTGARTRLSVSTQIEQTYDPEPWTADNQRATLSGGVTHITEGANRISGQLVYNAQASDNLNERYETLTAQVSYDWAEPVGPVQLSLAGGMSYSHYRDYTVIFAVPGGREDIRQFASLQALFPQIDYAGFVPVVSLGVQDTRSNVSRFDRKEFSLNIGVRSSF